MPHTNSRSAFFRPFARALTGLLLAGAASIASAHSHAIAQEPAANSTITTAPEHVVVKFDGRVELPFSVITVTGPDGKAVETGKLAYAADDQKSLSVSLPQVLTAGAYRIQWNVVSADSHKVQGSSNFTLQP